jgi:hypothetical protein
VREEILCTKGRYLCKEGGKKEKMRRGEEEGEEEGGIRGVMWMGKMGNIVNIVGHVRKSDGLRFNGSRQRLS